MQLLAVIAIAETVGRILGPIVVGDMYSAYGGRAAYCFSGGLLAAAAVVSVVLWSHRRTGGVTPNIWVQCSPRI